MQPRRRMMIMSRLLFPLMMAAGIVGCASPPAAPGFQADVLPIFQARCLRCHGESPPAIVLTSPDRVFVSPFRLDRLEDDQSSGTPGAKSMRGTVLDVITREWDDPLRMPPAPALPLIDLQIDTIAGWAGTGAP